MFSRDALAIDAPLTVAHVAQAIREQLRESLHRRGAVVGLSGGIDSSVVAALCVEALGRDRVLGLLMPERDSPPDSVSLAPQCAAQLGIETRLEDLTAQLEAAGCYWRQVEAIRAVFPDFEEGWRWKVTPPSLLHGERFVAFHLTVESPSGERRTSQMPARVYLQLTAATNIKQRLRKAVEYFHADGLHYAVAGTTNRLEYDQGFFAKQGDGAADFKPIAHLFKTQVYALAEHLGVPEAIRTRPPTSGSWSVPEQEELFFTLPWDRMDLCLCAHDEGVPPGQAAPVLGLTVAQVERIYRDIEAKRRATRYLHMSPLLVASTRSA